jgi:ATP adenylyltransferase
VRAATERALAAGALLPIATGCTFVQQAGVRFVVRALAGLERKHEQRAAARRLEQAQAAGPDPFGPYDERLFVADVSPTHVALLNKFNVMDHHVLLVTRAFEEQTAPLGVADFEALWACLTQVDGLCFHNAGPEAGASQRHKHLQLVPLPLAPGQPGAPIGPLVGAARFDSGLGRLPAFRFAHRVARLPYAPGIAAPRMARLTLEPYEAMLAELGLAGAGTAGAHAPTQPYNLLVTREWMLCVARSREHFGTVSVNALGFAGALLVRNEAELRAVLEAGPMAVQEAVACG